MCYSFAYIGWVACYDHNITIITKMDVLLQLICTEDGDATYTGLYASSSRKPIKTSSVQNKRRVGGKYYIHIRVEFRKERGCSRSIKPYPFFYVAHIYI